MNKTIISSLSSSSYTVITALIYSLLLLGILSGLNYANGEGEKGSGSNNSAATNNDNKTSIQGLGDPNCKSPCPSDTVMCVQMCA